MAEPLTAKYLEEHSANVQTYDSFARALVHGLLQDAKSKIEKGGAKELISYDAKIDIHPTSLLCIEVCISTPFGKICKHVGI